MSKLYAELVKELAKAGLTRTQEQIINNNYRHSKKELSKSGAGWDNMLPYYNLQRPPLTTHA